MSLEILSMQEQHLEGAAALVAASYRALCQTVPDLSPAYENAAAYMPSLRGLMDRSPGVVAVRDGEVAGFMTGFVIPEFLGKRCAYSPEWANAAHGTDSRWLYEEMYAHLSGQWVADDCHLHACTLMAHAPEAISALQWSGFGMLNADAVRDLGPVGGSAAAVRIYRASMSDLDTVKEMKEGLQRHMAAPPVFWRHELTDYGWWLSQPRNALWLADEGNRCRGMLAMASDNPEGPLILRDETTAHIQAAFTTEGARGTGIATALLNTALQWARANGYQRCAVDFETTNHPAMRFWLKRFKPVAYSLLRWIPD
jgi:GNAT superfamily N-acetyltransferase